MRERLRVWTEAVSHDLLTRSKSCTLESASSTGLVGASESSTHNDPWIEKYIFPNSLIPSARQISTAFEELFVLEDWHNFGADYDRTLLAWRANFDAAWAQLRARYDERFRRMWRFYLSASAAVFRCRRDHLWQLVLSPHGVPGGYIAPR